MPRRPCLAFLIPVALTLVGLVQSVGAHGAEPVTPVTADTLSDPIRQSIIDHFHKTLVVPELALWKFDFTRHYPTGGLAVCGQVNYTGSTRRYVGYHQFYARIVDNAVDSAGIVSTSVGEDPVRATKRAYEVACTD